ncbi:MAG: hypothetical protein K8T20_11005 [Planctomycetes bacterium]|nr:hypothetical protein [Planctomycetota bacterium]
MKRLLPLALLAAAPFFSGCSSLGEVKSWLGIKPASTEYGPFSASPKDVWEATRDVLADMDYTFAKSERSEWKMESRWNSYGSDFSHENHRYRVTVELEEAGNGTLMNLLVEHEANTGTDPIRPSEADWAGEGADEDMQNEIVYRVRKKIAGLEHGDIFQKTYDRLDKEDNTERPKAPDYGNGK